MIKNDLTALVARAAKFTSYRAYRYDADPMVKGPTAPVAVLEATELVRDHFARRDSLSSVKAEAYGAVTLSLGSSRIRLEPGIDARPKYLTARQASDLLIISASGHAKLRNVPKRGTVIACGLHGTIPPAATEKLIERGWIATTGADGAPVTVSLAGTVALTWRACKAANIIGERCAEQIAEAVHDVYRPEPADA